MSTILELDLEDFLSADPKRSNKFIKDLGDSLTEIGFFCLKNHGIDQELVNRSYQLTEELFLLPEEKKKKYEYLSLKGQRGLTSFGRESAKNSSNPDLKEFYHIGRESIQKNIWPKEIEDFKEISLKIFKEIENCALKLLEACSLYIGEERNRLSSIAEGGNSILRLIHYPPVTQKTSSIRAAAHEDINLITLLVEASTSGLELLDHKGNWQAIKTPKGQIIVDSCDMLQNITNGLFKSTTHRVVNPDDNYSRRFSMPFFTHPRPETDLSPLKKCITKFDGKQNYPSITANEYLEKRLKELGL
jgi:isopenicillin N synthase-like dioxygenase